ncbi:HAMP domain-containing protein [bacterium]|nr:HAMP domain-containing protein [bacterium]
MNLRLKLSLWYSLILFVSLFAAGMAGYWRIKHVLLQQFDIELTDEMFLVNALYQDEKRESDIERFKEFVSQSDFHHVVFGKNREYLFGSKDMSHTFPEMLPEDFRRLEAGATLFLQKDIGDIPHRIILQKAGDGSGDIIMLEEPLKRVDYVMVRLRAAALVLLTLFLILAMTGGWWMAGQALSPIGDVVRTATQIQESNMSLRIPVPAARDEVGRLIVTLNTMLDRIESAFDQIRRFTQDAAHELRTPLSSILSAVDVTLRRKDRTAGEYREALEAVRDETVRLQKLSDDLLTLARAEEGNSNGRTEVAGLCESVLKDMSAQISAKDVICELRVEKAYVPMSEDALARAVRNLLDNAVKFSTQSGRIQIIGRISVSDAPGADVSDIGRPVDQSYDLDVSDEGQGIPPEDIPHIFERFYRGANARSADIPGSGIGLSIARALARQAGGDLTAETAAPRGSRFRLHLPLADG